MTTCRFSVRICATICVLLLEARIFAADSLAWNSRNVEHPTEAINQVRLSDSDRVALNAALSVAVGPLSPNISAEEQLPDIRVKLIDLNGDQIPEVFAHLAGRFWCGATGNCPLWVFRKVDKAYEPMLLRQEVSSYQGLTVTHQRTGGYFDLIFNQHEGAF